MQCSKFSLVLAVIFAACVLSTVQGQDAPSEDAGGCAVKFLGYTLDQQLSQTLLIVLFAVSIAGLSLSLGLGIVVIMLCCEDRSPQTNVDMEDEYLDSDGDIDDVISHHNQRQESRKMREQSAQVAGIRKQTSQRSNQQRNNRDYPPPSRGHRNDVFFDERPQNMVDSRYGYPDDRRSRNQGKSRDVYPMERYDNHGYGNRGPSRNHRDPYSVRY